MRFKKCSPEAKEFMRKVRAKRKSSSVDISIPPRASIAFGKKGTCVFCSQPITHSRMLMAKNISIGLCEEHYNTKTLGELYEYINKKK